jgi:hypothetical protein
MKSRSLSLAVLLCINSQVMASERIEARYVIRLLGIPVGTASLSGTLSDNRYNLELSGRLTGLASLISRARGAAKATGALRHAHVFAQSFATTASNTQMSRTVRMALSDGNVRGVDIFPPFDDLPGRIPLTDEHKRSVVDPLSALVMPTSSKALSNDACKRSIAIFDGWTRFNIDLTYAGEQQVNVSGYAGPAIVCAVRYVPIAGHRPEREATKFMIENKDIEVWLAPLKDTGIVMPLKISVATMIGTTVIEALEFQSSHDSQPIHNMRHMGQIEPHP